MTDSPALAADLVTAGWALSDDGTAILKTFHFRGFRDAMTWMMRAGFDAEQLNHHPEWSNVYNRVDVRLTTHDTGGLTTKDIDLAQRMERVASNFTLA